MSRRSLLCLWAALAAAAHLLPGLVPAAADLPAQSPRMLRYAIEARLDPDAHTVTATGRLTWRNDAPVPVEEMWLHLYLNAFRDKFTAFMRESGGSHRGHRFDAERPGAIEVTSFAQGGEDLRPNARFVPSPRSPTDTTVLVVPLAEPIPPGASATFEVAWTSRLPKVFARTGHAGDFHMVAQWYPKPGVFESCPAADGEGTEWRWNCHAFHGSSEFYADYGVYDVRITVPEAYADKVGATGKRVEAETNADGTITYAFHAEDVHDFAWVAGRDFLVFEEDFPGGAGTAPAERDRVAEILGRNPAALDLPPVTVYFFLQPEHAGQLERHKRAIFEALTRMGFWFGPYPYPTLTVVDPDHRGRDAGGMEYPTLITGGTRLVRPRRRLSPEGVLVHEFAHQHFYGLIGTNEFENAWMDEGMTTYATAKTLEAAYPPDLEVTWYAGLPVYGERPIRFEGLAPASPQATGIVHPTVETHLRLPWGNVGFIDDLAGALGVDEPPETISLWMPTAEVSPLTFLREVPTIALFDPRPTGVFEGYRTWYASQPVVDPVAGRKAWEYMDRRAYGVNSYSRPANSLHTLEGLVGEETMVKVMRTYAERYRFGHPTPQDFFDTATEVVEESAGEDVSWVLDELFEQATGVDYGIHDIDVQEAPVPEGREGARWESVVTVRRYEGARLPVEVWVGFEGGTVRKLRWERDDALTSLDGEPVPTVLAPPRGEQQRWVRLWFEGPERVAFAATDPRALFALDRDRTNDGRRREPDTRAAWRVTLRMLGQVEMSTSFYGGL